MSTSPVRPLSADVAACPQLAPGDMPAVAEAGYRSVINNRPDFEGGPTQPTSADVEAAAHAAGLQYAYLPVDSAVQTPEQAAALADLLATLPKPVLLFCRSGARSARLFMAAQSV
ncbi:TIGR01244 family sulfur transferase [Piscinibacter koreensis]|uniref:TIGR01244 family phosphatase n=1 Tax=Piscinibacter koreensis TaxID=2742824 RepID=A0A7Y6TVG6_9BURK|nr:TIGR01244 family sulfur transferase [Schlegelella koreensis]NUZ04983.1 TIGR01244 family phosphatase [Schlegelella koreensis]